MQRNWKNYGRAAWKSKRAILKPRKARRSKVSLLTAAGFSLFPIIDGLFMFILKDPERARAMGLISVKAQLTAGGG
jgi:hypothetical protein